ncbi:glycoside hydrolase/deacetylase [Microthyrium microscopicum]|uniref:Glycoside hydrolase/deacetylase n=1 Tax=Microthyrium microscopicum TaxID=703497 RepID=A0A6A6UGJ5_9PEZI|nr:glycoside hydrolase/deacetylase [Microthyrium microscopicum]
MPSATSILAFGLTLLSQVRGFELEFTGARFPGDADSSSPFARWRTPGQGELVKRQGQKCGPSGGGAVCPASQCCSQDGLCGTGGYYCDAPACLWQWGPACDANVVPPGKSTKADPRPLFGNVPYGVVITHCTTPGKVALTFDDGPYLYTTQILDTLKAAGVKATFFVVAINGGKGEIDLSSSGYSPILQRMIADGHQIGSHTWAHQDLTQMTSAQRIDQITKNEVALTNILGFFPTYLRPPYTYTNPDVLSDLKTLGYHVVNQDLDTLDWQGDYNAAQNNFLGPISSNKPATSSYIVLSHDIHQQTVTQLVPFMITNLKKYGYTTATVGECLGDPPANWYRDPLSGSAVNASAVSAKQATNVTSAVPTPTAGNASDFHAGTGNSSSSSSNSPSTSSTKKSEVSSMVPSLSFVGLLSLLFAAFLG